MRHHPTGTVPWQQRAKSRLSSATALSCTVLLCLLWPVLLSAQTAAPPGPALKLEKKGQYIELPPGVFGGTVEGTVEAWVKLNGIQKHYQRIITCDSGDREARHLALMTDRGTGSLWFLII